MSSVTAKRSNSNSDLNTPAQPELLSRNFRGLSELQAEPLLNQELYGSHAQLIQSARLVEIRLVFKQRHTTPTVIDIHKCADFTDWQSCTFLATPTVEGKLEDKKLSVSSSSLQIVLKLHLLSLKCVCREYYMATHYTFIAIKCKY
jgi:hypothetical protein